MNTAVIFGCTGQDGSYLSELLLSKDYLVYGVARRVSVGNTKNIDHLKYHPRFHLVQGDITDMFSVYSILNKYMPYEIYNLAAQSHVGTSFDQPNLTTDVIVKGNMNCLEWLRDIYSRPFMVGQLPRYYHAGSSEMFGSSYTDDCYISDDGYAIYDKFQNENTPFKPCSPYGVAKLAAHNLVNVYRKAYGIHASSGILFNHESPRRGSEFVTQKIIQYIKQGKYAQALELGNIDSVRDWGFAPDFVYAQWLMLQQDKPDDYVISTGETHTITEFIEIAKKLSGAKFEVVSNNKFIRPYDVKYLNGRSDKAKKLLGWEPKVYFRELVEIMLD